MERPLNSREQEHFDNTRFDNCMKWLENFFKKQPTDNTCMETCLAMILDKDVYRFVEELQGDMKKSSDPTYSLSQLVIDKLDDNDIYYTQPFFPYSHDNFMQQKMGYNDIVLFLCSVPSLNNPLISHILIVAKIDDRQFFILDPNRNTCRKFYNKFANSDIINTDSFECIIDMGEELLFWNILLQFYVCDWSIVTKTRYYTMYEVNNE